MGCEVWHLGRDPIELLRVLSELGLPRRRLRFPFQHLGLSVVEPRGLLSHRLPLVVELRLRLSELALRAVDERLTRHRASSHRDHLTELLVAGGVGGGGRGGARTLRLHTGARGGGAARDRFEIHLRGRRCGGRAPEYDGPRLAVADGAVPAHPRRGRRRGSAGEPS